MCFVCFVFPSDCAVFRIGLTQESMSRMSMCMVWCALVVLIPPGQRLRANIYGQPAGSMYTNVYKWTIHMFIYIESTCTIAQWILHDIIQWPTSLRLESRWQHWEQQQSSQPACYLVQEPSWLCRQFLEQGISCLKWALDALQFTLAAEGFLLACPYFCHWFMKFNIVKICEDHSAIQRLKVELSWTSTEA